MKRLPFHSIRISTLITAVILSIFCTPSMMAGKGSSQDTTSYYQYKGTVIDAQSNEPLTFATLSIVNSNIATVCNSEGEFILKIPKSVDNAKIRISYLGYKTETINQADLKADKNKIKLELVTVSLSEINVFPKDPEYLIRAIMSKRDENYSDKYLSMTSFYRETVKKGRTYVSLSEAVVEVLKQPYLSPRQDYVKLFKARKAADYNKLDTLAFKLMGGPYTTVLLDIMKNPELIFTDDMIGFYSFSLNNITRINDRLVYILEFSPKTNVKDPLYHGKLYVDSESLAITSATFSLDVSDKNAATSMFIKKKPVGAHVFPTEATYMVNYREKDGKWLYGYSRGQINFKVDWDKKLFKSNFYTTIEMAATDWELSDEKVFKANERLKTNVIMEDAIQGFADKEFWGEYNLIEPEQSIEAAIKKIQKNIDKSSN